MRTLPRDSIQLGVINAIQIEGVPLTVQSVRSPFDDVEGNHDAANRFGVVWVDYEIQARIPKDSAHRYRRVISDGGFEEN